MKKTKFKKITTLFLSLVMLCTGFTLQSSASSIQEIEDSLEYEALYQLTQLYAYNGVSKYEVVITFFKHNETTNWTDAEELAEENRLDALYATNYPNAHRIQNANMRYNAHYYSFFEQDDIALPYWVVDPTDYMGAYSWQFEVFYDYRPRDIVGYYHDNGTPEDTSDDKLIHSGIISGYSTVTQSNGLCEDIDLYMVDSKWGSGGVYRHNGYECPYTNYSANPSNELRANSIRVFRFPNHEVCDNTETVTYAQHDGVLHQSICPCGQIIYEPHDIQRVIIDYGMNSVTPEVGLNAVVPPVLEEMVCVDCGYRP